MKKIVLFGSGSKTGRELIRQALLRGHYVVAVTSDPKCIAMTHPRLYLAHGEIADPQFIRTVIGDSTAAILVSDDCEDGVSDKVRAVEAQCIVEALVLQGVRRLISNSACGANSYLGFFAFWKHFFWPSAMSRSAAIQVDLVEKVIVNFGLDWTILRHPRLTDSLQTSQYFLTTIRLLQQRSTLARADLAAAMLNQLNSDKFLYRAPYVYE
ncbi:NAD(P)-dependent oxidoreductase [Undibacterium sp. RuTC16W]|uniref:NAD(P)-dependent oxidoreductase n=1 Tax=Undibacterium sp. RuTC16W TaxID=3413048 RepID=UPI003BF3525F